MVFLTRLMVMVVVEYIYVCACLHVYPGVYPCHALPVTFKVQNASRCVFLHESFAYLLAHGDDAAASTFARHGPGLISCPVH